MGFLDAIKSIGTVASSLNPFVAAGTSVLNGVLGAKSQSDANKTNLQIARENNEMQYKMMQEQNEFNRQQAIDMFNMENEYNGPSAVKERLEAAGINPNTAFSNSASSMLSSGDAATPQGANVPQLTTPTISPVPSVVNGMLQGITQLAQAQKDLSTAGNQDANARAINEKLGHEIDLILSEISKNGATELWQNTQAALAQSKAPYEIQNLSAEYVLLSNQGKAAEADAKLKKVEAALTKTKNKQLKEQAPVILQNLEATGELIREQQKTEKAKQRELDASAGEHNARAALTREQESQLRDMHEDNVAINAAIKQGKILDTGLLAKTFDEQVDVLKNQKLISDEQLKELKERAEIARKENTMYYWSYAFDKLERINDGITNWIPMAPSKVHEEYHGYDSQRGNYGYERDTYTRKWGK